MQGILSRVYLPSDNSLLLCLLIAFLCVELLLPTVARADFVIPTSLPAEKTLPTRVHIPVCVLVTAEHLEEQTKLVRESLLLFASMLRTGDALCVITVGSTAKLILPLTPIESPELLTQLRSLTYDSGNDLFGAISIATNQLEKAVIQGLFPHLLLLNFSALSPTNPGLISDLLCQLQKDRIRFSVIDSTSADNLELLSELTAHGFGEYRYASNSAQLRKQIATFTSQLASTSPIAAVVQTKEDVKYYYRSAQSTSKLLLVSAAPRCATILNSALSMNTTSNRQKLSNSALTSTHPSAHLQFLHPGFSTTTSKLELSPMEGSNPGNSTYSVLMKILDRLEALIVQDNLAEIESLILTELSARDQRNRESESELQVKATLSLIRTILAKHPLDSAQKLLYPLRQSPLDIDAVSDAL